MKNRKKRNRSFKQRERARKSSGRTPQHRTPKHGEASGKRDLSGEHHLMESVLTREEELKLILAAGMAKYPQSFCEDEISPVVGWARHVRLGEILLELTLVGHLLPTRLQQDGDVGFGPALGVLSGSAANRYLIELEKVRLNQRVCDDCLVKQAIGKQTRFLLATPMEDRLRLAVKMGRRKRCKGKRLEVKDILNWAREVLQEKGQLDAVLAGYLLPLAARNADEVTFRKTTELATDEQNSYRMKLQIIESNCAE